MKQRSNEQTRRYVEKVAEKNALTVNPDPEFTEQLIAGLTKNVNRYGYYSCPCRDASGDRSADRDIICPCVYNDPDQREYEQCFCALFLTGAKARGDSEPSPIPERRPPESRP